MKKLNTAKITEAQRRVIDAAVEIVGDVLAEFEEKNEQTFCYAPVVRLTVNREKDFSLEALCTPAPLPKKTAASWLVTMTGVGNAYGPTLQEALDGLCGMTCAEKLRDKARALRAAAERIEADAARLEADGTQGTEATDGNGGEA